MARSGDAYVHASRGGRIDDEPCTITSSKLLGAPGSLVGRGCSCAQQTWATRTIGLVASTSRQLGAGRLGAERCVDRGREQPCRNEWIAQPDGGAGGVRCGRGRRRDRIGRPRVSLPPRSATRPALRRVGKDRSSPCVGRSVLRRVRFRSWWAGSSGCGPDQRPLRRRRGACRSLSYGAYRVVGAKTASGASHIKRGTPVGRTSISCWCDAGRCDGGGNRHHRLVGMALGRRSDDYPRRQCGGLGRSFYLANRARANQRPLRS